MLIAGVFLFSYKFRIDNTDIKKFLHEKYK